MIEPWNIKQDDTRQSDSTPNFIIFCEDEVSEPIYFRYFETSNIKVNIIKNQKSKIDNVLKAICYCENAGLMRFQDGLSSLQDDGIRVWCVYDRDIEDSDEKQQLGNVAFNEAIETAKSKGFNVAWSNDAFELWILLHFEDVDLGNENFKNRDTYYARLTEIFNSLPNPNEDLTKALKHPTFNYKQDCKHEKNFRSIVRDEMVKKTKIALDRAKKLEEYYETLNIPNHTKAPCTLVHNLVKELIQLGGKQIIDFS